MWKYNKEKHTIENFLDGMTEILTSIPVHGKVNWKDNEDVTSKFNISLTEIAHCDECNRPADFWCYEFHTDSLSKGKLDTTAIPITAQEQF